MGELLLVVCRQNLARRVRRFFQVDVGVSTIAIHGNELQLATHVAGILREKYFAEAY